MRSLGGSPEALLRRAGIDPTAIAGAGIGYRAVATVLEQAALELRCSDFGMRLACLQGGGKAFGLMGLVMKNSSTFGQALNYVAEHSYAHSLAARVHLEPDRGGRFVGHEILLDGLAERRQIIEQFMLLGHLNARQITGGKAQVRRVLFRGRPVSAPATYRRHFGCEVRFEQEADGVVFSERDLNCPILDRDERLYERVTSIIDRRFSRAAQPVHAQVRALILEFIATEDCSDERVAAKLGLHPRTLRRRLKAEGESFQALKERVRRDVALSYLENTGLPLARIAEKLGYSAHSAFSRSCLAWFSATPSELRGRSAVRRGPRSDHHATTAPSVPDCQAPRRSAQ